MKLLTINMTGGDIEYYYIPHNDKYFISLDDLISTLKSSNHNYINMVALIKMLEKNRELGYELKLEDRIKQKTDGKTSQDIFNDLFNKFK